MDKNKLILPATILIASIILGGFYYLAEVNKQQSIERQQKAKFAQEQLKEERRKDEAKEMALQKSLCVAEAEESAITLYKNYCTQASYCTYEEGTFRTPQYEAAYARCLQRKGLK